jgi:hypothetical protein
MRCMATVHGRVVDCPFDPCPVPRLSSWTR